MTIQKEDIKKLNQRNDRLNQKLDLLEEQVIDTLIDLLNSSEDTIDRNKVQVCATAAGVLKANKRSIPPNLPVPLGNPLDGLVEDPEDLPTTFNGDRRS